MKILFSVFFLLSSQLVFAAKPIAPPVSSGGILPGPESVSLQGQPEAGQRYVVDQLIPALASGFTVVLLIIGVIMIIIAGIIYIFSSGDSEMTGKARDIILWTIVGLGIAMLSVALVKFVIGINFTPG